MLLTKLWDLYEQFSLKKCHSLYRKLCQLVEIDRRFSIPEHMLSEYLPSPTAKTQGRNPEGHNTKKGGLISAAPWI
jgi:hypothetical protein